MIAQGYADDFARFLQAGRIGTPVASVLIEMDGNAFVPSVAMIRGAVHASHARVRQLSWRMRGELAWSPVALHGNQFAIPGPGRVGTLELRSVAVASDDAADIVAWAFVELAWPAADVHVAEYPGEVRRHEPWTSRVNVCWIDELAVTLPDGSTALHAFAPGEAAALDIAGQSSVIGHHRIELAWHGLDGSRGVRTLEYEVKARPIHLELRPLREGGLFYRTAHAEALELHLSGAAVPQQLPLQGVIENTFLMPLCGLLRYQDESGEWRVEPIRLDHAPHRWPASRGFARV